MTMPNDKQSRAELRQHLGGVSVDLFGGDNLAIFLASEFEPGIEDETLDESGTWKQGAIDATNTVLDAIHAHYAPTIEVLEAENKRMAGALRAIDRIVENNIKDNGTEINRMNIKGEWFTGPLVDACFRILRGFQEVARSSLNPEREEK